MAAKGFTLVEVTVVIAVVGVIAALGLFVGMDVYRGFSYRSERDTVVSLLERARSHAMANVGQSPWGFCEDASAKTYLLFRGASYGPSAFVEESVPAAQAPAITGMPLCGTSAIVFTQLSGTTMALAQPITIQEGAAPADTITINGEGTIIW